MNVIYALGGGRGHATRAFTLAERLDREGTGPSVVLHQAPGDWPQAGLGRIRVEALFARLHGLLGSCDRFVVDTFPGGVAHELLDLEIPAHVETVLVARYVDRSTYAGYDRLLAGFDAVWLPYDRDTCEWDHPPDGTFIGPVVRPLRFEGEVDTLVIGRGAPPSWEPLLAGCTRVDHVFDTLPRARRVVALGAGYNLGFELATAGLDTGFRPLARRYDDQFRRAARLGTPLYHRSDLEGFLAC